MRILIDARPLIDVARGGVTRVARGVVAAYARAHPADEIICFTTGARKPTLPDGLAELGNVKHVHLTIPNKIWSSLSIFRIVSMVRTTERRVGPVDAIFLPNVGFVGNLCGRSYTILIHDLSFLIEPRWFTRWSWVWHRAVHARELITQSKAVLAVSETTKRDAIRILNVSAERITVIPLGSTNFVIPAKAGIHPRPSGRYILALGSGDVRKNAKTSIEAVSALQKESGFEDLELILVGAPPFARPSDEELAVLYQHASAFLYPSWYEGFGLPLHEATAFGTPCIASTSGVLPETAPPGTIFANPAKPHHWVEAIKIALALPRPQKMAQPRDWSAAATSLDRLFY